MLFSLFSSDVGFLEILVYILSSLAVIFITLPIHEFAHGFAAVKLGDNTPRWQGRMSLNPFAHIDYVGAVCILLFGFGWAKPVQINQNNFKNPKRDMAITALAGPLSNIVVALVALIVFNAVNSINAVLHSPLYYIAFFVYYIALINIRLAVFNLIPIPPLDGSRILSVVLPYRQYYALMRYERYIFWGLLALLWFGFLDLPINLLSNLLMNGLSYLAGLPFMLFN